MKSCDELPLYNGRRIFLLSLIALAVLAILWRIIDLQIYSQDFLAEQGKARHLRVLSLPANRGVISDRNGEPLAVSTPVDSIWANPQELILARDELPVLAKLLDKDLDSLQRMLAQRQNKEFVYLKRHLNPADARRIMQLNVPGVDVQREYRRYYPAGEVASHVVGFTNIDDIGQEGLELAFNDWLTGEEGSKRVVRDRLGQVIEDVEQIKAPNPGKSLQLSIDLRLQYLAYRELKAAVAMHKAKSGSAVVLDARTGEILSMVNQPSFNPNNRTGIRASLTRNRALTDVFEPGSTMKPFAVAMALEEGIVKPGTKINTAPGYMKVSGSVVQDFRNYGVLDVTHILTKSSNVGVSKLALELERESLWSFYANLGFGSVTATGFPGEASGVLSDYQRWSDIEVATLSFGYGLSMTPLQLASAYAVLANDGMRVPLSFVKSSELVRGERILSEETARKVREMLVTVTSDEGTAPLARVSGYSVAGKTGTVKKSSAGGYSEDEYIAVFAGMAPAVDPRLVMVVMINEPRGRDYYGGLVAAPVFSKVMAGALRLLNVAPDQTPVLQTKRVSREGAA